MARHELVTYARDHDAGDNHHKPLSRQGGPLKKKRGQDGPPKIRALPERGNKDHIICYKSINKLAVMPHLGWCGYRLFCKKAVSPAMTSHSTQRYTSVSFPVSWHSVHSDYLRWAPGNPLSLPVPIPEEEQMPSLERAIPISCFGGSSRFRLCGR